MESEIEIGKVQIFTVKEESSEPNLIHTYSQSEPSQIAVNLIDSTESRREFM